MPPPTPQSTMAPSPPRGRETAPRPAEASTTSASRSYPKPLDDLPLSLFAPTCIDADDSAHASATAPPPHLLTRGRSLFPFSVTGPFFFVIYAYGRRVTLVPAPLCHQSVNNATDSHSVPPLPPIPPPHDLSRPGTTAPPPAPLPPSRHTHLARLDPFLSTRGASR